MTRINHHGQPVGEELPDWTPPPIPPREPVQGRYCRLEPLDPEQHAQDLFEAIKARPDDRSWTYMPYGPFEIQEAYCRWVAEHATMNDPMFFAIIDEKTDKPVGVCSYLRIMPASGSIEVGHIHYTERLKQTPAATEAMYLMMKRAFELGYRRYEWKCDALNANSRKAAERLGMQYEGTFRQATVYKQRNRDTAWYAVIDKDWPALEQAFTNWLDPNNFDENDKQRNRLSDYIHHTNR